jgi:hypothetical protein
MEPDVIYDLLMACNQTSGEILDLLNLIAQMIPLGLGIIAGAVIASAFVSQWRPGA